MRCKLCRPIASYLMQSCVQCDFIKVAEDILNCMWNSKYKATEKEPNTATTVHLPHGDLAVITDCTICFTLACSRNDLLADLCQCDNCVNVITRTHQEMR